MITTRTRVPACSYDYGPAENVERNGRSRETYTKPVVDRKTILFERFRDNERFIFAYSVNVDKRTPRKRNHNVQYRIFRTNHRLNITFRRGNRQILSVT